MIFGTFFLSKMHINEEAYRVRDRIGGHFLIGQFAFPRHWSLGLLMDSLSLVRSLSILVAIRLGNLVNWISLFLRAQIHASKVNSTNFTVTVFQIILLLLTLTRDVLPR